MKLQSLLSEHEATPESWGELQSFRYQFGGFFEGRWEYRLTRQEKGMLLSVAHQGNAAPRAAGKTLPLQVAAELKALVVAKEIHLWNGFDESGDVRDGYRFFLRIEFQHHTITATGHMRQPAGYQKGHAALTAYLKQLAQ